MVSTNTQGRLPGNHLAKDLPVLGGPIDFREWSLKVKIMLKSKDMDDLILTDPTFTKPRWVEDQSVYERNVAEWKANDSEIQLFLLAHLSQGSKAKLLNRNFPNTAFHMWKCLHEIFDPLDHGP